MLDDSVLKIASGWLFDEGLKLWWRLIGAVLIVTIIWGALIYAAANHDNAWRLDPPGRGLADHYGFHACFLSGPLVLLNICWAVAYFLRLIRDIDQLLTSDLAKPTAAKICAPHVNSILLRGKAKYMLFLCWIIGSGFAIIIFSRLDNPAAYWGNDVFNACKYGLSYWSANAYLMVLWGLIYPTALFYIFHIVFSVQIIISRLMKRKLLRLNFLHVDGCGGMAKFGTLNLLLMAIYGWIALVLLALHVTHRLNYLSLIVGAVALTLLILAHSIFGIFWVAKAIKAQRNGEVTSLNERIRRMMDGKHSRFTAAVATMAYRDQVLAVPSLPYSRLNSVWVNILRATPAAAAVLRVTVLRNVVP